MQIWGTGTSPVQAIGSVSSQPVMRDNTSSVQTAGCGHTEIQQGLPVKQDYWLQGVAGDTQQVYRLQKITGYRVLSLTEKYAVPILTGKKPASNPVLTTGSPATDVSRLQRIAGDKLVGQEVSSEKFL